MTNSQLVSGRDDSKESVDQSTGRTAGHKVNRSIEIRIASAKGMCVTPCSIVSFDNEHFLPSSRKQGSGGKTSDSAPDDHYIVILES